MPRQALATPLIGILPPLRLPTARLLALLPRLLRQMLPLTGALTLWSGPLAGVFGPLVAMPGGNAGMNREGQGLGSTL